MSNVWVCKPDGTIQCDEDSKEITVEEMGKQLAMIIGKDNIISMKKTSVPMIQLCGMPTGNMNAYEITEAGVFLLERGFVGPLGFKRCTPREEKESLSSDINIGQVIGSLASRCPTTLRELIGYRLRAYKEGDPLTKDLRWDRVNIEIDSNGTIVDIWCG